jgi:DNA-binding transcriptional regulator GbsR (MarR family)
MQGTEAYGNIRSIGADDPLSSLSSVEARFIHNWAGLARAFGMDPLLGRIHAVAFLAARSVSVSHVAEVLGISVAQATDGLDELERWGVVQMAGENDEGERLYEADGDPWSWFLVTIKERGRREFGPLVHAIREAHASARAMRKRLDPNCAEARRIDRIGRFSEFVDQIAGLLETFSSLGAGPMMSAMRMVSKVRAPRLIRI